MSVRSTVFVVLLLAAQARAECLPSGRDTFAAGLEALGSGDLKTAFARFDELVKDQPDCAEARNNLAVVLFEMGLPEDADKQLRQAVEINPDYLRARANLRRVEASFRGDTVKPQIEAAVPAEATVAPTAEPTAAPTPPPASATAHATPVPHTPVAVPATPPIPANLAVLEPQGATAWVVDVARKQLCVFRREETGIVRDACYGIVAAQVSTWPQWVVASDVTTRRVRLVDDTQRRRLRIVPDTLEMDDSARVRQADFDDLAQRVVPWRSGWLVLRSAAPTLGAGTAQQAAAQVRDTMERWRQAWEGKKLDAYTAFYSTSFVPQREGNVARWRARKRTLFERSNTLSVSIAAPSVFVLGDGSRVVTVFQQMYRAGDAESKDLKVLRWQREGERWLISGEATFDENAPRPWARRRRGG